jgi:hypothetical protein
MNFPAIDGHATGTVCRIAALVSGTSHPPDAIGLNDIGTGGHLRTGPPRDGIHCLTIQPLGRLPLTIRQHAKSIVGICLSTFRVEPADRTRRLHAGHRLADHRSPARLIPGVPTATRFRCHLPSYDTSTAIPENEDCAPSFRSPPDAYPAPFPHRSPLRSSANAACGGSKPPTAGRLRRAKPSSPAQHHVMKLYPHRTPLHARGT